MRTCTVYDQINTTQMWSLNPLWENQQTIETSRSRRRTSKDFCLGSNNTCRLVNKRKYVFIQGPLYKWTEHSQNFIFWNYKVGGGFQFYPGAGWEWVFWPYSFISSHERSKILGFKLFKQKHFLMNFRFWLLLVELRKTKLWLHWIFYIGMKNIKLGHVLRFYEHKKVFSPEKK